MRKAQGKKRFSALFTAITAAVIFAVMTALSAVAVIGSDLSLFTGKGTLNAEGTGDNQKVQVKDLFERHDIDFVIGPLKERAGENGQYTGTYKDIYDNATNNEYGIPANNYFNADKYLYIEPQGDEKVLRGWEAGIRPIKTTEGTRWITEDGYIADSSGVSDTVGIYYNRINDSCKYMIIVPDEVTKVGYGNNAWDGYSKLKNSQYPANYYRNYFYVDYEEEGDDFENEVFTDFAYYQYDMYNNSNNVFHADYTKQNITYENYWSPRERLAGLYFNDDSELKEIVGGNYDSGSGWSSPKNCLRYRLVVGGDKANAQQTITTEDNRKAAFASCNNLRFCVLPNNNKLKTIGDYAFASCSQMVETNIPSGVGTFGTGAYINCSALVHISVPSTVTVSASNVFSGTTRLVDVENNSDALDDTSFPNVMNIYGDGKGKSQLFVIGTSDDDNGNNGFYYCKNTYGYNGALATITYPGVETINYAKDNWYVTGPAGRVNTTADLVYSLPAVIKKDEGAKQDVRRKEIKYDYLDSEGKAYKNSLDEDIDKYDIGANACNYTWCVNIVIPSTVDIIGDYAFYHANTQYMEIHASVLGRDAFFENRRSTLRVNDKTAAQYYYIHNKIEKYGTNVFSASAVSNSEDSVQSISRNYIFEDYALYTQSTTGGALTGPYNSYTSPRLDPDTGKTSVETVKLLVSTPLYQIPVVANVDSYDGDVNIINGDLSTAFYNDLDYLAGTYFADAESHTDADGKVISKYVKYIDKSYKKLDGKNYVYDEANPKQDGKYSIVVTKRLSGSAYNSVKQFNGVWATAAASNDALKTPVIEGMSVTQWYKDFDSVSTEYSNKLNPTGTADGFYNTGVYNSSSTGACDFYTKKVAHPVFDNDITYQFGTDVGEGDDEFLTFFNALKLNEDSKYDAGDYAIELGSFNYPTGAVDYPTKVQNAGTYNIKFKLDASEWGSWEEDDDRIAENKAKNVGTVEVLRKEIVIESIDDIPRFINTADGSELRGDGNNLYHYNDGWYLTKQNGKEPNETKTIINGYAYASGNNITVGVPQPDNAGYTITVTDAQASLTGEYYATVTFAVKYIGRTGETNYTFRRGENDNALSSQEHGLILDSKSTTVISLRKRWYIVNQTNIFVDVNETDLSDSAPLYVLATAGGGHDSVVNSWYYEDSVTVHTPRLLYNESYTDEEGNDADTVRTIEPTVEITYTPVSGNKVTLKSVDDEHDISYYINAAMPAGEYTVTLSGEKVRKADGASFKKYDAISSTYTVTVLPKPFSSDEMDGILEAMQGKSEDESGEDSKNEYPLDNKKLHDDITAEKNALNATLNVVRNKKDAAAGYWASADADKYYQNGVVIMYNRAGSSNNTYISDEEMLDLTVNPNTYTFYFSISANNYITAIDAPDSENRTYVFTTVLYADMKLTVILSEITDKNSPFFKDTNYTGSDAKTTVPYSADYYSDFNDPNGYVDVGRKYVTLTLNNPALAHWNDNIVDDSDNRIEINPEDESQIFVYFDIKAVDNGWNVTPQMPSWTFNGFKRSVNAVTAGLEFADTTVKYALIPDSIDPDTVDEWSVAGKDGNGIVYFTVSTSGTVDDATAVLLNALKPTDYYLKFFVDEIYAADGESVNVNAYNDVVRNNDGEAMKTVTVNKATNTWASTPNVMRWSFGSYNENETYITARATYPALLPKDAEGNPIAGFEYTNGEAELAKIKFVITDAEGKEQANFFAGDNVSATLKSLPAGSYVLTTSMGGSDYYTEIAETELPFEIYAANNSWNTQPIFTGFAYKNFDSENNFRAGVPAYPASSKKVYYVIGSEPFTEVKTLAEFQAAGYAPEGSIAFELENGASLPANVISYMQALTVDTYYYAVFVPSANDYSYLFYSASFDVSRASNGWKENVAPSISGWVYGEFDEALFTGGESVHGEVKYTVRKVVNGEADESDNGIVKIGNTALANMSYDALVLQLENLGAGTYSLQFTSGTSVNYEEVKSSKQFVVAMADNEWGTEPSVSGWVYGETAPAVNNGTVKYEASEASVDKKYYLTTTTAGGTLVADKNNEVSSVTGAGSYAYVLTVADTTNYRGFETVLFFTVEQADNDWVGDSPAGSYRWTWGDDISSLTANIVNAEATNGGVSFDLVRTDGDYTVPTGLSISELLAQLPVGEYTVTVSVSPDDDYKDVADAVAYLTVVAAQLEVTDPECTGWTWGADGQKNFTALTATAAKSTDAVDIKYSISSDGGKSWTTAVGYSAFTSDLFGIGAGEYTVKVTATCANHEPAERTVEFTVGKASFDWNVGDAPANANWAWNGNWQESDGGRNIPNLSAVDCEGNAVTLVYSIDGRSYADFVAVKGYLQSNERNAATYTVKVTASLDNHESEEKEFTVTVTVAANEWTETPALGKSYTIEYKAWESGAWTPLPTPTAKFGAVVIKYGTETVSDINVWLEDLTASTTPYKLTVSVAASANQYGALEKEVSITVKGIGSTWHNINELLAVSGATESASSYTAEYATGVFDSLVNSIVFPLGNPESEKKTTYSVYFGDSETVVYSSENFDTFKANCFKNPGTAGTYTITAYYEPLDSSYETLSYTITVTVTKAQVSWDERLGASYSKVYNSVSLPTPSADKDFANVTVVITESGSDKPLDMGDKTFSEFAEGLDAGTYVITATIDESDNYTVDGARQTTSMLYVIAVQNRWKDVTYGEKTISTEQWNEGYTWEFTRGDGDAIAVVLPEPAIGELTIGFLGYTINNLADLNRFIRYNEGIVGDYRAANTYSLRFSVTGNDNYNSLVSNCTVIIKKKGNEWTQTLLSATASGSVDTAKFTMPTAEVQTRKVGESDVDLRLYNIVKMGGEENDSWVTHTTFLSRLAELRDGTFAVTVRVGGDVPSTMLDDFKSAMAKYNADYETISCSCYITITPSGNSWTHKLTDNEWTFGQFGEEAELAAADFGNNTIVYTISGSKLAQDKVIKTSGYAEDIQNRVLKELNDFLKDLLPGTYNITATIDSTDTYTSPAEGNYAVYTVKKYVPTWNLTAEQTEQYRLVRITWKGAQSNVLPALTAKFTNKYGDIDNACKVSDVVWKIGNTPLEGTLADALNGLGVGTYVVTATFGDDYNAEIVFTATVIIEQVQTAWVDPDGTLGDSSTLSWKYGERKSTDVLPSLQIANWTGKAIKYSVTSGNITTTIAADEWATYLADNTLGVGTYTFTAYVEGDDNHTDKTYTVIVTVETQVVKWSESTETAIKQHSWVLSATGNSTLTPPELLTEIDGCTVEYKLVKVTESALARSVTRQVLYTGSNWSGDNSVMSVLAGQKAGTYEITATVSGDTNYVLPATVTYTVTISAEPNEWVTKPASTVNWIYKDADNEEIEFVPKYNNDKTHLHITVGGKSVDPDELMDKLGALGVGSHTIVAYVDADEEYAAPETLTVTLEISQASDSLGSYNVPASWDWDDVNQKTDKDGVAWQTLWNKNLAVPVPEVSTTATAIVYKGSEEMFAATLHYVTEDGVKSVLESDLNALKSKLLGLHVGSYRIRFTVADSANYKGCYVEASFAVTKVNNYWDGEAGKPKIAGWQYESSVANPSATPMYGKGTVKFSYAKAGTETEQQLIDGTVTLAWQNSTDTAGGTYWLRATVDGTADYNSLVGYAKFSINAGKNDWVTNPGVIAWNWDSYDKNVNLFSGSAKNNGEATFRIFASVNGSSKNLDNNYFVWSGATLEKTDAQIRKLFCEDGFTLSKASEGSNVMVVSDEVAQWLKALMPGNYVLSVTIAADNNYDELSGSVNFTVNKAANGWKTNKAPAVSSYVYGTTDFSAIFSKGEAVYGSERDVKYELSGATLDGEPVSTVTFTSTAGGKAAYDKVLDKLAILGAGYYTLSAWMDATDCYATPYTSSSPYSSRTFTVSRAANSWTTSLVTEISKTYGDVHNAAFNFATFKSWYGELVPVSGTDVKYSLLTAGYNSIRDGESTYDDLTYNELFDAVKKVPAGEYVIRAKVAESDDYLAIGNTDTRFTISTHKNKFTSMPDALTAQWAQAANGVDNATVLTDFEVKADYGEDTVTYTLENGTSVTYYSYSAFKAAVVGLDAKSYNVTIAIAATNDYEGLSVVRMLTVTPAANVWENGWKEEDSLSVAGSTAGAVSSWGYGSSIEWERAVPKYGKIVYVEIRKVGESSALQYTTIDYSKGNGDGAVQTVSSAVSLLHVGTYEIIVSVPATGNWGALTATTQFTVTKVANGWNTNPWVSGVTYNAATDTYEWTYGDNVSTENFRSEAKFGVARFEYSTASGNLPTEAGNYTIKFVVDESTDYFGTEAEIEVEILKAYDPDFSETFGAIGWTWGEYDRAVNLFTGRPVTTDKENAVVKFSVGTGMGEDFVALPDLDKFSLISGLVEKDSKVEKALKALTGGVSAQNNFTQYTLHIYVSATDNYQGFEREIPFNVTGATNTWIKTPTVMPWIAGSWTSENMPSAVSLHGAPEITVKDEAGTTVYFHGKYKSDEETGELVLDADVNILNQVAPGSYVMTTVVAASIGQYNSPLSSTYPFRIYAKGEGEGNYWEEIPAIDGWTANIDGIYNLPAGKPIRGLPNFVFYKVNEDGSRELVDSKNSDLVLPKGNSYEADIYIPLEPGSYIMIATSKGYPAEADKSDSPVEVPVPFTIADRPLSFAEEPRIDTLLYLGDRANWADATAKASLADARVTYVYTNKETGESSSEMPTAPGLYTVTATVSALYCKSMSKSVDFTVELSPNSWVAAPNIKDWAEGKDSNIPNGAASVGTDEIQYTYAYAKDPYNTFTEKPTAEGSYVMYADINVEGYTPLHAEYYFTIESAYDRDLLVVDVILGVVACAMAVVVIIFAIRRYKEN